MANRSNILVIFPDQWRGDTLGAVGHPAVRTPHLDRLAADGVTFTRCYTNSPLCLPARASLMSGRYVCEHGVWDNSISADRFGPSHVRDIRDAGYHTAQVGKVHLSAPRDALGSLRHAPPSPALPDAPVQPLPPPSRAGLRQTLLHDWGFEDTHELTGPQASAFQDSPYTDYLAARGLLATYRQYMLDNVSRVRSNDIRPWEEPPFVLPSEHHLDLYTARKAAAWIRGYTARQPFYLQVGFPGPHDPFDSPAEYRALYRPEDMPLGSLALPDGPVPPYVERMAQRTSRFGDVSPRQIQTMRTHYYGKVTLIDEGIGQILAAMAEKDLLDNTWIIMTSDHGEMLGDHLLISKFVMYEGAVHIPCVVRPPAGTARWRTSALTELVDITATLREIAGVETPADNPGRSLVSQVLAGPAGHGAQCGKEAVFSELSGYSMVRTESHKMVIHAGTREVVELYDLRSDPHETRNLAGDPSFENLRQELRTTHLAPLLARTNMPAFEVFRTPPGQALRP